MNYYDPAQTDMFASFESTSVSINEKTTDTSCSIPTLADYGETIAEVIWKKDHTRKTGLRGLRWFREFQYGSLPITEISRKHIYQFVDHLVATKRHGPNKDKPMSQCTAQKYMAALSRVINHAYEYEVVENPIKLKYKSFKNSRPRFFTPEEEAELVQYLRDLKKDWMADMVILSCNTGMRRGEILQIKNPIVKLSSCGEWLYLPEELCKAGARDVPLNNKAKAAYERLLHTIDRFSHTTFYNVWRKVKRDVGKGDKNFVFHVCRHTAATRLANDVKASEFNIADILGHADTRTTRIYVHSQKKTLKAAVDSL